jgi:hypothetical protein
MSYQEWSIGIYRGDDVLHLLPASDVANPVLTSQMVTDVTAKYVADPFMIRSNRQWYMFFEVVATSDKHGKIGLATSIDALRWSYDRIVLQEPFHLSYPYVFKWREEIYMIPETREAGTVRLYRAVGFPTRWVLHRVLFEGEFLDPSVIYYNGLWWLFVGEIGGCLRLFYSNDLDGVWKAHPRNPLIEHNDITSRPAGRLVRADGRLLRFAQDGIPFYGTRVRAFELSVLNKINYVENELDNSPVLQATKQRWNEFGIHHVDPHRDNQGRWLACVDGWTFPERPHLENLSSSAIAVCIITSAYLNDVETIQIPCKVLNPNDNAEITIHVVSIGHGPGVSRVSRSPLRTAGFVVHRIVTDPQDKSSRHTIETFLRGLDKAMSFKIFYPQSQELARYCEAVTEYNGGRPIVIG